MEPFNDRLRRFLAHEDEVPLTLLLWAENLLLPQLRVAKEKQLENLMFLGTHTFIQTFSEKVLGRQGRAATKYFLESLMDEAPPRRQFSRISDELHELRNVMAHQLFSSRTHEIAIDYTMAEGWRRDQAILRVNPDVYAEQFISAVDGGRLWKWRNFVTADQRLKQKYLFVRDWLDLRKTDPIWQTIETLTTLASIQDIQNAAAAIDVQMSQRYGL